MVWGSRQKGGLHWQKVALWPHVQTSHFYIYGCLEARAKPLETQVQSAWVLITWAYKFPGHFKWTTIGFTKKLPVDFYHKGHIAGTES